MSTSLVEIYEARMERIERSYQSIGVEPGVRPAYRRSLSTQTQQKLVLVDRRVQLARERFKEQLERYREALLTSVNEEVVDDIVVETSPLAPSLREDVEYQQIRYELSRTRRYADDVLFFESMEAFRRAYPERFSAYREQEKTFVYRDAAGRPDIELDHTFHQMFLPREYGGLGYMRHSEKDRLEAYAVLLTHYPDRAQAYAHTTPALYKVIQSSERKK